MGIPESHGCLRAATIQPSGHKLEDERGAKLNVAAGQEALIQAWAFSARRSDSRIEQYSAFPG
jgi:hypothetical protein